MCRGKICSQGCDIIPLLMIPLKPFGNSSLESVLDSFVAIPNVSAEEIRMGLYSWFKQRENFPLGYIVS